MRRVAPLLPALLLAAPVLWACRAGPNHPVLQRSTDPIPDPSRAAVVLDEPPPATPLGAEARARFFEGFADAEGPLHLLAETPSGPGEVPRLRLLAQMEAEVLRRYGRAGPLGRVRLATAIGVSGHVPVSPTRMADLITNPEAERLALGADHFRGLGTTTSEDGRERRTFRVELLRRGEGPIRFDFRITMALQRWDLDDGVVLMRYDPVSVPAPENVTLYRGACLLEPAPGGARVTEFLVLGTDVSIPFFLEGHLREMVIEVFRERVRRLWSYAHGLARQPAGR